MREIERQIDGEEVGVTEVSTTRHGHAELTKLT